MQAVRGGDVGDDLTRGDERVGGVERRQRAGDNFELRRELELPVERETRRDTCLAGNEFRVEGLQLDSSVVQGVGDSGEGLELGRAGGEAARDAPECIGLTESEKWRIGGLDLPTGVVDGRDRVRGR